MNPIYELTKQAIKNGLRDGIPEKLDAFLLVGRITLGEYEELLGLYEEMSKPKEPVYSETLTEEELQKELEERNKVVEKEKEEARREQEEIDRVREEALEREKELKERAEESEEAVEKEAEKEDEEVEADGE